MKSLKYNEGYQIGLTWQHEHKPGGPFHYTTTSNKPEHIYMAQQSVIEWQDYMQGWKDGIAQQKAMLLN